MTQYRTPGLYWQPHTKAELIKCIIDSGQWHDTRQKLKDMETRQIRAIFHRIRHEQFIDMMRKPVENKLTKVEYGGNVDTVKGEL